MNLKLPAPALTLSLRDLMQNLHTERLNYAPQGCPLCRGKGYCWGWALVIRIYTLLKCPQCYGTGHSKPPTPPKRNANL
jgi:hypothetical protein